MRHLTYITALLFTSLAAVTGQGEQTWLEGKVSFLTSTNIYVKFASTDQIQPGDTLYARDGESYVPCITVNNKSSTSCVGSPISDCRPEKGALLFARVAPAEEKGSDRPTAGPGREKSARRAKDKEVDSGVPVEPAARDSSSRQNDDVTERQADEEGRADDPDAQIDEALLPDEAPGPSRGGRKQRVEKPIKRERYRAMISLANYSSFSDSYNNHHRSMARVSFDAEHINETGWSLEAYGNYRRNQKVAKEPGNGSVEDFYRVYNLALHYEADSNYQFSVGRKINRRASSLGAIDGLQGEKQLGDFFIGAIAGFRPDLFTYKINTKLFEYGVYGGFSNYRGSLRGESTLGLLEQQNAGEVDRRYLYAQHHSTLGRDLYLFGSAELDLYARVNDRTTVKPRLTNLFVSARYRFSRKADLTLSYDSRRQIIFYETLQTEVERLLADDEARQGLRLRLNYRPARLISTGLSLSRRFQTSMQNPSDNLNGYINHSRLPYLGGRLSLNANVNRSAYLISRIASFRYARDIVKKYLDGELYYRHVAYQYRTNDLALQQSYLGASLQYRISHTLALSVLYEFSKQKTADNHRLNTRLIKRFR